MRSRQSGQTLVATVIVIAIIAILAVALLSGGFGGGGSNRPDGLGKTMPTKTKLSAQDAVCRVKLDNARAAIKIASIEPDVTPQSIDDLNLPASERACPIGNEPYVFNAADQTIKCVHPGHEKF
jgi:hypothetical protein